ncbi:MAG TPA: YggS family pyridoxal phosphate-dependent enzyme [Epulopiscium sp.]|nr:YggS family pyridoxal phosphate-dependent enzyme [Candidatus Epulonipiscium sp.]
MINHSIETIKEEIKKAAISSGRNPEEVMLIAVTKTRTTDEMKTVEELGLINFGENRVQELEKKYHAFGDHINWHIIGHLQRNKVKYIIHKVKLIHSVDSLKLATAIDTEAAKENKIIHILLQVNIANEDTKFGLTVAEVIPLLKEIALLKNIKVQGLMTIAPYTEDPEENRKYFRGLKNLSVDINSQKIDNIYIKELSMGMTNDYIVAVEEGSTMIRVGTGIFGNRDYNRNKEVL